ncbi:TonB-like protein [Roseimicrobium gellanilyticum]|uniref:TonB-like protein n=1 Tax=Roseimicrobium gellanilyticum TaxID=748857 RepID=A0A366HBA9_9BACT|nr:energy transducer TonB [Roseimicrobium gellanilyticum]RBP39652.1 TonB-like protein [Roseimicrobium gellanilyticum]
MTHAESRTITYAIVGSLAVHVVLALAFAVWIGVASFHQMLAAPRPDLAEEPEVVLLFPDPPNLDVATPPPPPPPPPAEKKMDPYIRTTQNTAVAEAPKDANFESDRNTVAMTRGTAASTPDGPPMPSMEGLDRETKELANRTYKAGETKDDSAPATPPEKPSPPPTPPKVAETPPAPAPKPEPEPLPVPPPPPVTAPAPPPPVAEVKPKELEKKEEEAPAPPPPTPQMAKKEDSPAEAMMKELDQKLAEEPPKAEPPKPAPESPKTLPPPEPAKPPIMREAAEEVPIPKAIPVAKPVVNTPKPQENAFQPETHRGKIKGSISNVGDEDAVAAAATPAGRYKRIVTSAIEKKWHQYRIQRMDAVEPGHMSLRFYVNKKGKIEDLKILEEKASPLFEDFTIEAILKAEIPPLPADLVPMLDKERLEMTYNIVIHP